MVFEQVGSVREHRQNIKNISLVEKNHRKLKGGRGEQKGRGRSEKP